MIDGDLVGDPEPQTGMCTIKNCVLAKKGKANFCHPHDNIRAVIMYQYDHGNGGSTENRTKVAEQMKGPPSLQNRKL